MNKDSPILFLVCKNGTKVNYFVYEQGENRLILLSSDIFHEFIFEVFT